MGASLGARVLRTPVSLVVVLVQSDLMRNSDLTHVSDRGYAYAYARSGEVDE